MAKTFIALLVFGLLPALAVAAEVVVEGLMPGAAVLNIAGQRKLLRVGQTHAAVTLVAVDTRTATVRVGGETRVLDMSRHVGTNYQVPDVQVVSIPRNSRMQYQTGAQINGRGVQVMVDTGANIVAMSTAQAAALGVDYRAGELTEVQTASGVARAYLVTLRSVDVGGIRVDNVEASVVEGDYPTTILLGMTYLRHVSISEENGVLSLSRAN